MTRSTPHYGWFFPSSYFSYIFLWKLHYCFLWPFSSCCFVSWATAQIILPIESRKGAVPQSCCQPRQLYWLKVWKAHPTKLTSCCSHSSCELLFVYFLSLWQRHKKAEELFLDLDQSWRWSLVSSYVIVVAGPYPWNLSCGEGFWIKSRNRVHAFTSKVSTRFKTAIWTPCFLFYSKGSSLVFNQETYFI